jgi:hypothetical protein
MLMPLPPPRADSNVDVTDEDDVDEVVLEVDEVVAMTKRTVPGPVS